MHNGLIVLLFLGEEIYEAFKPSNVSRFAHITGGLLGAVFGFYLNAKKHIECRSLNMVYIKLQSNVQIQF